jgi:hypothetical protein
VTARPDLVRQLIPDRRDARHDSGGVLRLRPNAAEQVAATVAAWEREHGLEPRDWDAVGAAERDELEPERG